MVIMSPIIATPQAQMNKLDEVIRQAEIGPEDHVLEIGCGWGGFAIRAAQVCGVGSCVGRSQPPTQVG